MLRLPILSAWSTPKHSLGLYIHICIVTFTAFFYVLLTVHLSIISVTDQLNAQNLVL